MAIYEAHKNSNMLLKMLPRAWYFMYEVCLVTSGNVIIDKVNVRILYVIVA